MAYFVAQSARLRNLFFEVAAAVLNGSLFLGWPGQLETSAKIRFSAFRHPEPVEGSAS
jgi:hypothetical protein